MAATRSRQWQRVPTLAARRRPWRGATTLVALGLITLPLLVGPVVAATTATTAPHRPSPADTFAVAGWVTDAAHILTPGDVAAISARLAQVERRTHHQIVVVTVPTLAGEDVGAFTDRLGNRWGIGRRGINDGVVFLIAPVDHKVRISVGYGLLKALPDPRSAAIIDRVILPHFRAGRLRDGIIAGVAAIAAAVDPAPPAVPPRQKQL